MSDIADILARKQFSEPPEIAAIKKYVKENFNAEISISLKPDAIVVTAGNSSLASALRLSSEKIKVTCQLTKPLVFRIG
jgi:hypothetical protein